MRWTMVVLAGLMVFSAGCAANRNMRGDNSMEVAPSKLALQNEEAIKAGIGDNVAAADVNDPNGGWSVPPGQSTPGRPDSDTQGIAGQAPSGGAASPMGMRPGSPGMAGGSSSSRNGAPGTTGTSSSSPSFFNDRGSKGNGSKGNGAMAGGGMSDGIQKGGSTTDGSMQARQGMSRGMQGAPGMGVIVSPNGDQSRETGVQRNQPLVKPLVPAFPVRVRQERLTALRPVRFNFDSAELNEDTRSVLMNNAEWMKANPDVSIRVEGHADERGSAEYNLALGERRAKQVREYLIGLGVKSANLVTVSYGEEMPIDSDSSENAWNLNRRAEFSRLDNRAVSVNTVVTPTR